MDTHALLTTLHQQGFTLKPLPKGNLEIRPASRLTPELREELKKRKPEILPLLSAMTWLRSKLTTPQRIAPLISEWLGTMDQPTGKSIDDLMNARWTLGVHAYIGDDERFWWRLEQETRQ